eukprot:gene6499-3138_t
MSKSKAREQFIGYVAPFAGFMLFCWYGLAQAVENKQHLRNETRGLESLEEKATSGLESLEELDPMERLQRRFKLDEEKAKPKIPSIDEELADHLQRNPNLKEWDYKPVPRTEDD